MAALDSWTRLRLHALDRAAGGQMRRERAFCGKTRASAERCCASSQVGAAHPRCAMTSYLGADRRVAVAVRARMGLIRS